MQPAFQCRGRFSDCWRRDLDARTKGQSRHFGFVDMFVKWESSGVHCIGERMGDYVHRKNADIANVASGVL
ncbi:hypothetical protein D3C73_595590 [compost metagenome]